MADILIVDDAMFMRKVLTKALTAGGHAVAGEAGTAKQAIDVYKEVKPDLVTMDIVMPEEDDITTLNAVESIMESDPSAVILMCSSMGQDAWVTDCMAAGAKGFITKPFKAEQVIEKINEVLNGDAVASA